MPLIKSQDAQRLDGLTVLDLADLSRAAEDLRNRAEAQARQILAEAHEQAREAYQKGYADGRAAGRDDALKQGEESLSRIESAWSEALTRWEADRRCMVEDAKRSVIELALAVAEKIVRRVPRIDPTVVVEQVAEALRHVTRPHDAVVRVHPSDRPFVERCMPRLAAAFDGCEHIACVDDPSVEPGGCVVTCGRGRVDATLDRQIARVAETLLPHSEEGLEAA